MWARWRSVWFCMLDLVIRDGLVVDGTGAAPAEMDVGIEGDRIAELGGVGPARQVLDAAGLVVAPGFVDAHTHDDMQLCRDQHNRDKLLQGVTTVVCGSCGFSAFPHRPGQVYSDLLATDGPWRSFAEYSQTLLQQGIGSNVAAFVGHNTLLRHHASGAASPSSPGMSHSREHHLVEQFHSREHQPAKQRHSRGRLSARTSQSILDGVRRAVEQGALGVSTGLIYEAGRDASTEELVELAQAAAQVGGLYSTHLRDEGDSLLPAIEEALLVGQESGAGVQISHLKAIGANNWGNIGAALDLIDRAWAQGQDVGFDVYPYTAGSGPMAQYFESGDIDSERAALVQIVRCADFPDYEGRRLVEIAQAEGVDLADVTRRVITAPRSAETICVIFEIDEDDMRSVLAHPRAMVGSDGIPQDDGVPHPRLLGTFPRVLGQYSREERLFDLPTAVQKMTSLSAVRYGLEGRGRIQPGAWADLAVFDHKTVRDTGTYEQRRRPEGIRWVIVNGEVAVTPQGISGALAGRVLHKAET